MRPLVLLFAIPLVLGCAQQSGIRETPGPTNRPMRVRLHQPTGGALSYSLSEPGYVAIFAVTRGHGISLVFPYYESQMDYPSRAGLNQQTVHGGSGSWGYTAGARNEHRALFGYADAYYVIASKYPLPLEGMIRSPYLLRSLLGADRFRVNSLTETSDAVEAILVSQLPHDAWASDVYFNWRGPSLSLGPQLERLSYYCGEGYGYLVRSLPAFNRCGSNQAFASNSPVPTTAAARRGPPAEPLDRNPSIPVAPPRLDPGAAVARTARGEGGELQRERSQREAASARPSAPAPQPAPQPASPPSRPAEAQPQTAPDRPASRPSEPPSDP